jgi:hypothetical protein
MTSYDEETLAALLRALPAPPQAWVEAAREIPLARGHLDEIVARAEADQAFRAALIADLEAALEAEGFQPEKDLVQALRKRFTS